MKATSECSWISTRETRVGSRARGSSALAEKPGFAPPASVHYWPWTTKHAQGWNSSSPCWQLITDCTPRIGLNTSWESMQQHTIMSITLEAASWFIQAHHGLSAAVYCVWKESCQGNSSVWWSSRAGKRWCLLNGECGGLYMLSPRSGTIRRCGPFGVGVTL